MSFKEYIEYVKQDMRRTYKDASSLEKKLDRTDIFRIYIIFILNTCGIIGVALMKENFPVPIFVAIGGISALILFDILRRVFTQDIAENMPNVFSTEQKKYGVPTHEFKCFINFIGNTHFRGFNCRVLIYSDIVIIKLGKNCLIIDSPAQIKISKVLFGYRCEFEKNSKYVQCNMNKKQAELLQHWQARWHLAQTNGDD